MNPIQKPSPNFTPGRAGTTMDLIIIHSTEGGYSQSVGWLCNPVADASAHYVIKEDGSEITQLVQDKDTAWHAGNWQYNLRAIGVEHSWYSNGRYGLPSDALYRAGAELVANLCQKYGITADRSHIIAHREVPPPNDHVDPDSHGLWDWGKYMSYINAALSNTPAPAPSEQPGQAQGYFADTDKWVVNDLPDGTHIGFLDFFTQHGAIPIFGLPITGAYFHSGLGLTVQWFERSRFEYHPGIGVQLGLLGAEAQK